MAQRTETPSQAADAPSPSRPASAELSARGIDRRTLLRSLAHGAAVCAAVPSALLPELAAPRRELMQESPVAGFQYHDGERAWSALYIGQVLTLRREPNNYYDPRAVEVRAGAHKLGYVPRLDNCAASQLLDRGARLHARITALRSGSNPWQRIRFAIELET